MKITIMRIALVAALTLAGSAPNPRAQDWITQDSGTAQLLQDVWFVDAERGWAVGDAGTSIATVDRGETWSPFFLTGQDLQGVAFKDANVGLVVGDNGLIFRTANGGLSWGLVASGTGSNLAGVAFGSAGRAYAVGRDGVILRSENDGASWIPVETGDDRYRDVWAVGPERAWIVGDGGILRVTDDGGLSWSTQFPAGGSDLKTVHFVNAQQGWIGGQNDTLMRSSDGGLTWTASAAGIFVGIDALWFVDASRGWAAGGAGQVFISNDGGLTWATEPSGTTNQLNSFFFLDGARGWLVGDLGTVLHRLDLTDAPAGAARIGEFAGYPNPFNPKTTLRFELDAAQDATLSLHDASGRLVRVLARGRLEAGEHRLVWDGRGDDGEFQASGIYHARLEAGGEARSIKLVLTK